MYDDIDLCHIQLHGSMSGSNHHCKVTPDSFNMTFIKHSYRVLYHTRTCLGYSYINSDCRYCISWVGHLIGNRWCRISSINSITHGLPPNPALKQPLKLHTLKPLPRGAKWMIRDGYTSSLRLQTAPFGRFLVGVLFRKNMRRH